MTKHCILHFGFPKTGSSSIQKFLRRDLVDPGFSYPLSSSELSLQDDSHNRALVAAFQSHPEKYHAHAKEGVATLELEARGRWFRNSLRTHTLESASQNLILSAEVLSSFDKNDLKKLLAFLESLSVQTSAIGYVRKYKQFQESRFQQALRSPGPNRRLLPPGDSRFMSFGYKENTEKFLQIFGADAVVVRKYERQSLEEGCVVRDFCKTIGISQAFPASTQENKSLSLDAIRLLYTHRKFCLIGFQREDPSLSDHLLAEKLTELSGSRVAFHSSLLRQSEEYWRADVDWISEFLGEEMLGDLFADDDKPCIRNEDDLFCFSTDSLEWLARETGLAYSKLNQATPEVIADAVGILRDKTLSGVSVQRGFITRAKVFLNRFFEPTRRQVG